MMKRLGAALFLTLLTSLTMAQTLTVYSGRNEAFVGPVIAAFEQDTGLRVEVRYGNTAQLAAQMLEEGQASPADVYLAQDAGALGALEAAGLFATLSEEILNSVDPRFRSDSGAWVGITGRARVVVAREGTEIPASVFDLTGESYRGRTGWAPTNASFQAFVTGMRVLYGEEATREWLEGMAANDVQVYQNNTAIVDAVGRGEIDYGLVNHYYLYRFLAEDPDFPVRNYFLSDADIGALVNVAGAGVLASSDQQDAAREFVRYLLSEEAQLHFAESVSEYPLAEGVAAPESLPALSELETPDIDLSDLADLEGTLELLQETGALE